ncbi:MAG TPA: response regulator [Bryobacteraceae bacterium]|jgi:CheY-like chemotaxis protein
MTNSLPVPPNILLVDDNRDGLLVRSSLLVEVGFSVEIAPNGEEGLKLFNSSTFDVVVTDYRMPRMNGVELIERIRMVNPNARVILLSGFVEPLGLTEENTGADVVLSKSSNEAVHLVRWVKRLVNRGASRKPPATQKSQTAKMRTSTR